MTHTEAVNSLASERYLLEEMTDPEREDFEAHYFECDECAQDVKMGALMQDGARAGFVAGPQVARIATFTPVQKRKDEAIVTARALSQAWYRSAALPWAVAATLAVVVGYQTTNPRTPATPTAEALSAVLLRPASRGTVPVVSVSASHVAVALDVDAGRATELTYELRDTTAAVIRSGRAPAPAAGSPLLLVIPTFTLKPQQQYILSVRDAAEPDRALGDYAFATTP
jgi:anti-sigma factor RsiW